MYPAVPFRDFLPSLLSPFLEFAIARYNIQILISKFLNLVMFGLHFRRMV